MSRWTIQLSATHATWRMLQHQISKFSSGTIGGLADVEISKISKCACPELNKDAPMLTPLPRTDRLELPRESLQQIPGPPLSASRRQKLVVPPPGTLGLRCEPVFSKPTSNSVCARNLYPATDAEVSQTMHLRPYF